MAVIIEPMVRKIVCVSLWKGFEICFKLFHCQFGFQLFKNRQAFWFLLLIWRFRKLTVSADGYDFITTSFTRISR